MLKLKHLFNNQDLALMIVKNWITTDEVPPLFKYYRISANAIYPFTINDEVFFLRFRPQVSTSKENILAELEFLKYLKRNDYSVVENILSKNGKEIETVQTPWGVYDAVVFKRVLGKQLSELSISDEIVYKWGKNLGNLHLLSKEFNNPQYKRKSWKDQFNWMRDVLVDIPTEHAAKDELDLLEEFFLGLPITKNNFGLIHFDFEPDNVFYSQDSDMFTPIDFDDSVYHWFIMDIERTLNSISDEFPNKNYKELSEHFIKGYRSVMTINNDILSYMPLFTRYANLYGYVRILLSTYEKWNNEPVWMSGLRGYLEKLMVKRSCKFGDSIK